MSWRHGFASGFGILGWYGAHQVVYLNVIASGVRMYWVLYLGGYSCKLPGVIMSELSSHINIFNKYFFTKWRTGFIQWKSERSTEWLKYSFFLKNFLYGYLTTRKNSGWWTGIKTYVCTYINQDFSLNPTVIRTLL